MWYITLPSNYTSKHLGTIDTSSFQGKIHPSAQPSGCCLNLLLIMSHKFFNRRQVWTASRPYKLCNIFYEIVKCLTLNIWYVICISKILVHENCIIALGFIHILRSVTTLMLFRSYNNVGQQRIFNFLTDVKLFNTFQILNFYCIHNIF